MKLLINTLQGLKREFEQSKDCVIIEKQCNNDQKAVQRSKKDQRI